MKPWHFIAIVSMLLLTTNIQASLGADGFATSNVGIANLQVSAPINGTAMNLHTNQCLQNVEFTGNVGSELIVNPSHPTQLVGSTQFVYDLINNFFSGSAGVVDSNDGGVTWSQHLVTAFDCSKPNSSGSVGTYDPSLAIDDTGNLYETVLSVIRGQFPLYIAKSTDGGVTWTLANRGEPISETQQRNIVSGKGRLAIDNFQGSPHFGTIYVAWIAFQIGTKLVGNIMISRSTDHGQSFSQPVPITSTSVGNVSYVNPILAIGPDGTLYVSYVSMTALPSTESNVPDYGLRDEYVTQSTDGGVTFTSPVMVASTINHGYENAPYRTSQFQSFTVNPANGHLLLAVEQVVRAKYQVVYGNYTEVLAERTDVTVYESTNNGQTWGAPVTVNDDPPPLNEDAYQPVIATSPNGLVAVAFYDRRLPCPNEPWILPNDVGKENFCIDTAIQFYNDTTSLTPIGGNVRVTRYSWDPMNPGKIGERSGVSDVWYIGDNFGLAISKATAYVLFAANFDLGANPGYNMQLFFAPVTLNITIASSSNSTTLLQSQTSISSVQTAVEAGNQNSPLMVGACLIVFAVVVLVAIKRRRVVG